MRDIEALLHADLAAGGSEFLVWSKKMEKRFNTVDHFDFLDEFNPGAEATSVPSERRSEIAGSPNLTGISISDRTSDLDTDDHHLVEPNIIPENDVQTDGGESSDSGERLNSNGVTVSERSSAPAVQYLPAAPGFDAAGVDPLTDGSGDFFGGPSIHDIDIKPEDYSVQAGKELDAQERTWWFGELYVKTKQFVDSRGELNLADGGATYDGGFNLYDSYETNALGNKTRAEFYNVYEKIVGGDGDDVIYGAGRLDLVERPYDHDDVIFGGAGNDRIYGLEGNDTISGGVGDDKIYGGAGNDVLYGGAGNDIIDGGDGTDTLYGGLGNDWLFSGMAKSGHGQTEMYGGSGSDVFVVGQRSGFEQKNTPFDWMGFATDAIYNVGGLIPVVGGYVKTAKEIVTALPFFTEGNTSENTWDGSNAAIVKDFNPGEDVLVVPLNRDGTPNAHIKLEGLVAGEAFRIYEDSESTKLIAVVYWDDLAKTLGVDLSTFSATEITALKNSIANTMLIMDSDQVVDRSGQALDLGPEDLSGLGSGRFLVIGSHSGQLVRGSNQSEYQFGTGHNDVVMGYNYGAGGDAASADDDVLYGFGGDDLFIPGAGRNTIYGGGGSDTVGYFDASSGINVDMTDRTADESGRGDYYVIRADYRDRDDGPVVTSSDRLFSVENVVGTSHNDTFKGDERNNTFVSGLGNDTMTGGAGADSFVMSGGRNVITDYNQNDGDRIVVDMASYNLTSYTQVHTHDIGNGDFRLVKHNDPNQVIVEFSSESVNNFARGMMDENGNTRFYLTHGDNEFTMTETDSYVRGLSGDDTIYGSNASEIIYGDSGNDRLYGGGGNDYLSGDDGNDLIYGDDGNDIIRGGRGDDYLYGGNGDDKIFSGGADGIGPWGWDRLYGENGDDVLVHDGAKKAHLFGGNGNDKMFNLDGSSHMWGGDGDDLMVVSEGHAVADGGAGRDSFVMDGGKMVILNYEMGDTIFIDYESYGYSSADEIVLGWSTVHKDGSVEYHDKATGEMMLSVHGDWDGYSGPSIKPTTGDWSEWYM